VEIPVPREQYQVSIEQRRNATKYLREGRDAVERHVNNLTEEQWNFKPSAQEWSILGVLEHLVIFEAFTHQVISSMKDTPLDGSDHDPGEIEQFLLRTVPDRSKKLQTPLPGHPSGRWKSAEALEQFLLLRARTQELLEESPFLRGRIVPNPLYSSPDWDGYSWIIAAALHTSRHILQIEELKNDPGFPRDSGADARSSLAGGSSVPTVR
jgi:DinB superfamily